MNISPEDDALDLKEVLVKAYRSAKKERYKRIGSWKFDKWIFTSAMLLIFGWLYFVGSSYNWELDYFSCGEVSQFYDAGVTCHNPFYKPTTWKNIEELPAGEYGQKLGPFFNSVYYVPVVLLFLAFYINYKVYNGRGKK